MRRGITPHRRDNNARTPQQIPAEPPLLNTCRITIHGSAESSSIVSMAS
jgi:hypothetical protein